MSLRKLIYMAAVVVLAVPIIGMFKRTAFIGRKKLSEKEIVEIFGCGDGGMDALRFLSHIYEVPLGLLRPSDTFTEDGALWKWDSWSFGEGQDRLNEFVWSHGLEGEHPDWAIADFVSWYVTSVGEKGSWCDS